MALLDDDRFARNFIGGDWALSREGYELDVQDPREGTSLLDVPRSSRRDVARAVEVGVDGARAWRRLGPSAQRARLRDAVGRLEGKRSLLAQVLVLDTGMPPDAAEAAVARLIVAARRTIEATPVPGEGPTSRADGPRLFAHLPAASALPAVLLEPLADLLAGRAVLLKGPEAAPLSAVVLGMCLEGLPRGSFGLVQGVDGDSASQLAALPGVDALRYHGGRALAATVLRAAASTLKPVLLRTYGPRRLVVLEGAALREVATAVREELRHRAASPYAGGWVVHVGPSQGAPMRELLAAAIGALDPARSASALQPLPDESSLRRAEALVSQAERDGYRRWVGGEAGRRARGYYLAPALLEGPDPTSRLLALDRPAPLVFLHVVHDLEEVPRTAPACAAPTTHWGPDGARELPPESLDLRLSGQSGT